MAARPDKDHAKHQLRAQLERLKQARNPALPGNRSQQLEILQTWQQQRLAAGYADLRAQPRFNAACTFFINDLYGPQDFSQRDADVERIYPIMVRLLPAAVLGTVAWAVELDALSHDLDRRTALALPPGEPVTLESYALAYCRGTSVSERRHQLALLLSIGREIDRLVRKPLIWDLLRMCRWPARMAGLGALQSFLERGCDAFRQLKGAAPFLHHISQRERAFMRQVLDLGEPGGVPLPMPVLELAG